MQKCDDCGNDQPSGAEDRTPSGPIVRIQPPLDLLSILVAEDAHDTGLDIHAVTPSAHEAHGADVVVACEHVAFREPESKASQPFEPGEKRSPTPDVASHVVFPRDMPYGVGRDQASEFCVVA